MVRRYDQRNRRPGRGGGGKEVIFIEINRVTKLLSYNNVKMWSCFDVVENEQYRGVRI